MVAGRSVGKAGDRWFDWLAGLEGLNTRALVGRKDNFLEGTSDGLI